MPPAASHLAVLLLFFAATCSFPAAVVGRGLSQTAESDDASSNNRLIDQCTAVAGRTSTDCMPGCQVCLAPAGAANQNLNGWPLKRRTCVCCAPGHVPQVNNKTSCRMVSELALQRHYHRHCNCAASWSDSLHSQGCVKVHCHTRVCVACCVYQSNVSCSQPQHTKRTLAAAQCQSLAAHTVQQRCNLHERRLTHRHATAELISSSPYMPCTCCNFRL